MSVTYSGDPSATPRDAVRFLLRDTSTSDAEFEDAEIEWLVSEQPNVYKAAANGARAKAAEASDSLASKTVGSLTLTYSERATRWLDIAKTLDAQANKGLGSTIQPYSGGISKSDKEATASEDDYDPPFFWRGQFDNPGAQTDYTYHDSP